MLPSKELCCGCGVCANVCSKDACSMQKDNEGFLYPVIDTNKCVNCGKCERTCPIFAGQKYFTVSNSNVSYCGHFEDEIKVKESASGGVATALTELIVDRGGVVYGVAYSDDYLYAHHIRCTTRDDIIKLRGSKYNQSRKEGIYKSIECDLKNGCLVLFIGMPCEIVGLKSYLGKTYERLLTCDLICEGTTSEKVLSDFVSELETRYNDKIIEFSARYKRFEWAPAYIYAKFKRGKTFCKLAHFTDYGEAHNVFLRPSCYNCKFKGDNRASDITVGDCWGIPRDSELWNRYGVSVMLVHTEEGRMLLEQLTDFKIIDYPYDGSKNPRLITPAKCSPERIIFSDSISELGLKKTCNKARSRSKWIKRLVYALTSDYLVQKIKEVRG